MKDASRRAKTSRVSSLFSFRQFPKTSLNLDQLGIGQAPELGGLAVNFGLNRGQFLVLGCWFLVVDDVVRLHREFGQALMHLVLLVEFGDADVPKPMQCTHIVETGEFTVCTQDRLTSCVCPESNSEDRERTRAPSWWVAVSGQAGRNGWLSGSPVWPG